MSKQKGFKRKQPEVSQPTLMRLDPAGTTPDKLENLLYEVLHNAQAECTYKTLRNMANIQPSVRLALNIKLVLGIMCDGKIRPNLLGVLTADEYSLLCTIDSSGVSLDSRRIAHTLFDISARIKVVQEFGAQIRHYNTQSAHKLIERPLDGR